MAHVNEAHEGSHIVTCHPHVYPQMEGAMPAFTLQPQYSFPVPLREGG